VSTFTPAETAACQRLVEMALEEDLGTGGDLTSQAVIPADLPGKAIFVARAEGILAGLPVVAMVLDAVDPRMDFRPQRMDGKPLKRGDRLATVTGRMRSILAAERTALNFLQRLSGIATLTRRYLEAVAGCRARILDTRKTTPGWRLLEKYAVRQGGGKNHRLGLYDGVLIKDNHLAALPETDSPIGTAVVAARKYVGGSVPVEIEVDDLDQFDEALALSPEIILLDNMSLEDLREAVGRRDAKEGRAHFQPNEPLTLLEASGGVNLDTIRAIAETGVDRISVGALTHSAPGLDIALDYLKEIQ
jgi:nicotinate-nucleotide pyrophosphorylase (carboxylating)